MGAVETISVRHFAAKPIYKILYKTDMPYCY